MRVLVTGGAGYLGTVLIEELLKKNHEIKVIDNLMFGYREILKNTELINSDITKMEHFGDILKNVDSVIHLAAIVGDVAADMNRDYSIKLNFLATERLAKACKKYNKRFVYASTCSVYGDQKDREINEESGISPVSVYALTKFAAEESIMKLSDNNFNPIIFRMGTLFGLSHRMRFDLVINLFIAKALQEEKITVFGGKQWRPFVHIRDVCDFYIKAIANDSGGIFNIGGTNYTINQVAEIIKNNINCNIEIRKELEDKRNYIVSSKKAINEFEINFKKDIKFAIDEIKNAKLGNYKNPIYNNSKIQEAYV
jgi:nucleoside-diphosphate-sugar epimerase